MTYVSHKSVTTIYFDKWGVVLSIPMLRLLCDVTRQYGGYTMQINIVQSYYISSENIVKSISTPGSCLENRLTLKLKIISKLDIIGKHTYYIGSSFAILDRYKFLANTEALSLNTIINTSSILISLLLRKIKKKTDTPFRKTPLTNHGASWLDWRIQTSNPFNFKRPFRILSSELTLYYRLLI